MPRHPFVETIARYFNGANSGDVGLMMSCFAEDIAAYTIGMPPRFGSRAAAEFFIANQPTKARWTIDHAVVQEPEAVVEWSVLWTPPGESAEVLSRGIDWFVFEDENIKEIREYCDPRMTPQLPSVHQLEQFPYDSRGYPLEKNLDLKLPN